MTARERSSLSLQKGGYLGEISALCFVHVPPHISSFPFLLVGTGSQMLLYDVELGTLLNSFHVFDGIRVHGISCSSLDVTYDGLCSEITSTVVVFGEKRIKLFSLRLEMQTSQSRSMVSADLVLNLTLPRFSQWVMDVLFLKEDHMSAEYEGNNYLAVGLGENSVCLWDISRSSMVFDVRCPEKTLLYSMRLWGSNINSFLVASGTIYNEVIVWKVVSLRHSSSPANSLGNSNSCNKLLGNKSWLHNKNYEAVYLSRLTGHEGSIFRLAWSPDGSKLMSVSDDRSARIWNIDAMMKDSAKASIDGPDSDVLILFGHSARVWDCSISESLIVTAGEDCTCRVWGMDGKQLLLIKEHTGRGIWRCTYDPISSLLITAGFDSSVKVHMLQASLSRGTAEQNRVVVEGFKEKMEVLTLSVPNLSDQLKLLNSKSEYVRCLHFTQEDILYVATNNGYLYHVKFSSATDVKWTELVRVSEDVPIVCMDLLTTERSNLSRVEEDWIAVGDGKGNMTVVRVAAGDVSPVVLLTFTWSAGMERQLLGTYWCNSLGPGYIFTADPRGTLKLWKIHDPLQSGLAQTSGNIEALLTAEFTSCFGTRVVCLDASFDEQVLVCGDLRGNLIMFSLSKGLSTLITSEMKDSPISSFKGAHGISSVTSISVSTSFNQVDVRSTGADGCICYFKYDREWRGLEFTGMKQVKELSLIQFVSPDAGSDEDLARGNYAVGFASSDFIIWNLLNEMKVVQVSCGGWRRPHSYYLGDVPERQSCFAFVKDHTIHIHKLWVSDTEKKLSHVLHMQYHGREIHTLCFISDALQSGSDEYKHFNGFSCIATGCEDGTVRLTRYASDYQNWTASKLLGEHVGGSAVRSICFISRIYRTAVDRTYMSNDQDGCNLASNEVNNPFLLISVGAKRVLTSWRLQRRRSSREFKESKNCADHCQRALPSMSFQWLSTDMPTKFSSTHIKIDNTKDSIVQGNDATNGRTGPSNYKLDSKGLLGDVSENDWRYLDVTAFLVKGTDYRSTVCFVVVSCSDATLTLRALILPYRLWFDVAVFVPQTSPVLSLQYVVLPIGATSQGNLQVGCAYILISGSTDGSLTFWDLTESVEGFMQRFSNSQPENFADCQIRPRTGRGSQGGRWWKKLNSPQINDISGSEEGREDSPFGISEIGPFHVLKNVHQSGVNCLHVSNMSPDENTESISASYCVLSGGDDQALNCLTFKLSLQKPRDDDGYKHVDHVTDLRHGIKLPLQSENHRCTIQFLSHDRVASAHSSAVKGVWTDGRWAFTAGLDQRVRCWELKEQSILHEHGHLVVSVTEPETLDAKACGRNQYQIAVAGRGVEMVEFCASQDIALEVESK